MKVIGHPNLQLVQQHEKAMNANVKLGGYGMPPVDEFILYHVILDSDDCSRVFVLADFRKFTRGVTCRLQDVLPKAELEQVAPFIRNPLDLRSAVNCELMIVSVDASLGPLIIIDGNHRAIAHYTTHNTVAGVPAFICVHGRISSWDYVPPRARGPSDSSCAELVVPSEP